MNWLLLKNSLLVSALTTVLAAGFGIMAALCLTGLEPRWRNVFLTAAIVALALPPFLVTNCWLHFLGYSGVWRGWLPLDIVSFGGTIWILSLLTWPITLLAVLSAWRQLEPAQLESDPTVTGWALIRALLWPLGRAALIQAAVLTFVLALNNFAVPAILQVKVFPAEIWVRFTTTFDTVGALKLAWPLVAAPLLLLLWLHRRGLPWPRLQSPVSAKLFRQQLGPGWTLGCGAGTVALCVLSVGLPLFQLISVKRTWTELPGALAAGQLALWNSFWFAAAAATVVIATGLAGATLINKSEARRRDLINTGALARWTSAPWTGKLFQQFGITTEKPLKRLALPGTSGHRAKAPVLMRGDLLHTVSLLMWLPFLLPGVLLGLALIALFNHAWVWPFYQSAGIVILAFTIRYLALGGNTVAHALGTVDPDLTDAARLSGATRWQMLRHIHWPQIAPQVLAAWYVIFLLCLWDVESMILVMPPGGETLALRVFNLLHYGHNAQVNALCLTLLGVAVAPLALWGGFRGVRSLFQPAAKPITEYAPRCTVIFAAVALLFVAGCGPRNAPTGGRIESKLFSQVQIIGSRGAGVGELNKPRSVAVDTHDNLYVVDMTGRVQKFSPDGVFSLFWQMPQTDKGKPKGMCRDREGNIVVIEPHYQRINYFSQAGKLLGQWGERGTNAGQLIMPRAAAVNSRGEIFVSEYSEVERVQKFKCGPINAGEPMKPELLFGIGKMGNAPGEFNRPEGLCVDAQDRIYVADSCNHRIQIFSSDGKFLRAYGKAGNGKGELSYPYDICVDTAGRQYVCEFGNSRIQIFDANDEPIEIIGGPGAEPGKFSNPWGVALDSAGNLYVADSQNHRVQKFLRSERVAAQRRSADIPGHSDVIFQGRHGNSSNGGASKVAADRNVRAPLLTFFN